MNAPATAFPPPRVAPHLAHAWGGVWRLTYRAFLTPGKLLLTLGLLALMAFVMAATVRTGRVTSFENWTAFFYFSQVLPILTFLLGAGALRDEMKPGAVDYILIRPVPRPAFVAFKYLAHVICVQLVMLLALGVLVGVGTLRQIPDLGAALPGLLLAQTMTIIAFTAIGFLCAVLTRRYIFLGLAWGVFFEFGAGNLPTELNRLSVTHQARALIEPYLPATSANFVPEQGAFSIIALLLVFSGALLALTAFIFTRRELAGAKGA